MQELIKALKNKDKDIRITHKDKWLVFYEGQWVVFQKPHGARKNRVPYRGSDFNQALKILIQDNE